MKKQTGNILFTLLALLMCAALSLGILAFGPGRAGANERLAPKPKLTGKQGVNTAVLTDTADWIADHFWLRQELITLRARLSAALGGSTAEDVILGSDGWLYYGDTLADYCGLAPMTEAELDAVAGNLALMWEYCRDRGVGFLFVPAPNKNSLYPEHMPDLGVRGEERDLRRLLERLEALGVPCADLESAFRQQGETLYYAHDSHWTPRGAALAADRILAALGRRTDWFGGDFSRSERHAGDLYEMLYPAALDPETGPVYGGSLEYTRAGSDTKPDSITIDTTGPGEGCLLCFRDSFGNDLYPYLAAAFGKARFSRSTGYDLTQAVSMGADTLILELVERNLRRLAETVPNVPAPLRQLPPAGETGQSAALSRETGGLKDHVLFRGSLPENAGRILLRCGDYAYETCLLTGGGFAAWLPEGEEPDALICLAGDTCRVCPLTWGD